MSQEMSSRSHPSEEFVSLHRHIGRSPYSQQEKGERQCPQGKSGGKEQDAYNRIFCRLPISWSKYKSRVSRLPALNFVCSFITWDTALSPKNMMSTPATLSANSRLLPGDDGEEADEKG